MSRGDGADGAGASWHIEDARTFAKERDDAIRDLNLVREKAVRLRRVLDSLHTSLKNLTHEVDMALGDK